MITGREFKKIRERKELSLRDIGTFCEVSPQLIGQIEQGKKYFTEKNYRQIINAMNIAYDMKTKGKIKEIRHNKNK